MRIKNLEEMKKNSEEFDLLLENIESLFIQVDPNKGFLVIGDMADPNNAYIVPRMVEMSEDCESSDKSINAFMLDWHSDNSVEFLLHLKHCLANSKESEVVDELMRFLPSALVFHKNSTCGFHAPEFVDTINKMHNLKTVVLGGVLLDYCVIDIAIPLKTYFNQVNRNVDVIVACDAVATFDSSDHSREEYTEMSYKFLERTGIILATDYSFKNNSYKSLVRKK